MHVLAADTAYLLKQVVTLRDWVPVLHSTMDVTEVDSQPKKNASPANAIFLIVFIFVGAFYLMRLFVGVIVSYFRQFSGTALLTERQQEFLIMKRLLKSVRPMIPPPPQQWRKKVYIFVQRSGWFEFCVITAVLLHVAVLASQHISQPQVSNCTIPQPPPPPSSPYFFRCLLSSVLGNFCGGGPLVFCCALLY